MNTTETNEIFDSKIKECNQRVFLEASPLNSGQRSPLDKSLTDDDFYNHLYANSKRADELVTFIENEIHLDDTHNFILTGYKGCGKSTFIGYYLRKAKTRSRIIRFDEQWEPEVGIKYNIAMYLIDVLYRDLRSQDDNERGIVAQKYIDIFYKNSNSEYIERKIDDNNFLKYFCDKVKWAYKLSLDKDVVAIDRYLNDDIKKHLFSGRITQILQVLLFWDIAYKYAMNENKECCMIFENLDVIYNSSEIPALVESIVAFRNNIDILSESLFYKGEVISDPTQDYTFLLVMRETTKAEFSNCIDHFSDQKIRFKSIMYISDVYNLYSIISKRLDYLRWLSETRPEYMESDKFRQLIQSIECLKKMLKDPYIHEHIFSLFNHDYRTCIRALDELDLLDETYVKAIERIDAITPQVAGTSLYWHRSLLFRKIFNQFVKLKYFNMVRRYDYTVQDEGKFGSVNLARMMLVYLYNSTDILDPSKLEEREYVPLGEVFSNMLKICEKPDVIVDALWKMFDLRKEEKWNHLVTFDGINPIEKGELTKEMDKVLSRENDYHFSQVRITRAGEVYLSFILPHFEYYSARHEFGNKESLFSSDIETLCEYDSIMKTVTGTRKELKICLSQLFLYDVNVIDNIPEFHAERFLNSKFASTRYSERSQSISRMYHGEKVIHSCIGYIDSLRFYIFDVIDQAVKENIVYHADVTKFFQIVKSINPQLVEKIDKDLYIDNAIFHVSANGSNCVELKVIKNEQLFRTITVNHVDLATIIKVVYNYALTNEIIQYMMLFGFHGGTQCTMYSETSNYTCLLFDACMELKIIPSKYTDFKTEINVETGEKLMR